MRNYVALIRINKQRQKTCEKCFLIACGDIESNPGPFTADSLMSVLTTRLAQIGLIPVNVVGDGNCFFRSVSYQLYHTETHHAQIRALAIQHLINCPEHFIESNTCHSWLQYLQNMSRLGTWADHIIIQAVANSNNLRIHITESAPNFSESTVVNSIYYANEPGGNMRPRSIYIGHLDEIHYVSTTPIDQSVSQKTDNLITITASGNTDNPTNHRTNIAKQKSDMTSSQKPVTKSKTRKEYMTEYMKRKRTNNDFKRRENERKRQYNKKHKFLNPEKFKTSWQKATAAYKQANPDKVKESRMKGKAKYKKSNPEKIKASSKGSNIVYKQNHPDKVKDTQRRMYIKRLLACRESENEMSEHKRCKGSSGVYENPASSTPQVMTKAIELFHENISVGPEYVCTCCDQLWYKSSVTKCNPALYKLCSREILNSCVTGLRSIDNTEWICAVHATRT